MQLDLLLIYNCCMNCLGEATCRMQQPSSVLLNGVDYASQRSTTGNPNSTLESTHFQSSATSFPKSAPSFVISVHLSTLCCRSDGVIFWNWISAGGVGAIGRCLQVELQCTLDCLSKGLDVSDVHMGSTFADFFSQVAHPDTNPEATADAQHYFHEVLESPEFQSFFATLPKMAVLVLYLPSLLLDQIEQTEDATINHVGADLSPEPLQVSGCCKMSPIQILQLVERFC